jgi:hypothetical protein
MIPDVYVGGNSMGFNAQVHIKTSKGMRTNTFKYQISSSGKPRTDLTGNVNQSGVNFTGVKFVEELEV